MIPLPTNLVFSVYYLSHCYDNTDRGTKGRGFIWAHGFEGDSCHGGENMTEFMRAGDAAETSSLVAGVCSAVYHIQACWGAESPDLSRDSL